MKKPCGRLFAELMTQAENGGRRRPRRHGRRVRRMGSRGSILKKNMRQSRTGLRCGERGSIRAGLSRRAASGTFALDRVSQAVALDRPAVVPSNPAIGLAASSRSRTCISPRTRALSDIPPPRG